MTASVDVDDSQACRWPKANAGQGGYANAYRKLGLVLREADTKSGHWHYWYTDTA